MDLGLKGKVALVTGGSKGIGKATALGFSREGARVAICARGEEGLKRAADEIKTATGNEVLAIRADVASRDEIEALMAAVMECFQRIDVLVNNVGTGIPRGFLGVTDEEFLRIADVNLLSAIRCCRAVIPQMQAYGWGRIINISSIFGKEPSPMETAYNITKAGLISLTRTLSQEFGRFNILTNCVCPGVTRTDLSAWYLGQVAAKTGIPPEEISQTLIARMPLGRIGEPEEVANLVVFLGSERSSYINGVTILVDGGMAKALY